MNVTQTRKMGSNAVAYLKNPSVGRWRKLAALAAIAYVFLPMDAVPDVIPLFGWLDDVGVLSAAAMFLLRDVNKRAPA